MSPSPTRVDLVFNPHFFGARYIVMGVFSFGIARRRSLHAPKFDRPRHGRRDWKIDDGADIRYSVVVFFAAAIETESALFLLDISISRADATGLRLSGMRFFGCLFAFLLLAPCLVIKVSWSAKSSETPLVWKKKPVRLSERPASPKVQWESIAQARKRRGAKGVSSIATNRKACGFYFWDFVSAGLYHTCHYLMKGRVYEGRGGRKFVRIEPGSLLQLLHPCSRHSPDKCVFCGGTFQDHLTLWWSKQLYSPYDLYLDRTYENGVLQRVDADRPRSSSRRKAQIQDDEPTHRYSFHNSYVLDLSILLQGTTKARDGTRKLRQAIAESTYLSDPVEMHVVDQLKTAYVLPSLDDVPNDGPGVLLLKYVRNVLLDELDALLVYQANENRELQVEATKEAGR